MSLHRYTRRWFTPLVFSTPLWRVAIGEGAISRDVSITDFGAVADDATINTKAIQAAIDHVAGTDGGTVIVPKGVFVSGALFLKPKVNLHLEKDAVLKCSTDMANFPVQRTRIEGHFEEKFNPALINAKNCDGLRITGEGTLDGAGRPIWDLFWKLRAAAPNPGNFPNVGVPRARMALIESSRGVTIEGITFKDSQFWNLHLYRCQDVLVRQARFQVPDDYKRAPSTDGIDLDSCQDVTIDGWGDLRNLCWNRRHRLRSRRPRLIWESWKWLWLPNTASTFTDRRRRNPRASAATLTRPTTSRV